MNRSIVAWGRKGFTLLELLVVVGIIAVLAAFLMPALNRARKHAEEVKCAANLRTIGQALTMYTQHYGRYPACLIHNIDDYAIWPPRLRAFMNGDQGVFHCPSQDDSIRWRKDTAPPGVIAQWATEVHARYGYDVGELLLTLEAVPFSYGYNLWGTDAASSLPPAQQLGLGFVMLIGVPPHYAMSGEVSASRIKRPSEMIAVADAVPDKWGDFIITPSAEYAKGPAGTDRRSMQPGRIHRGGANVLFCDGHVTWYLQKELVLTGDYFVDRPKYRMWNNTNQ